MPKYGHILKLVGFSWKLAYILILRWRIQICKNKIKGNNYFTHKLG